MITPYEIENKEFSKSMRGYSIEEVDEFLDQIILDLEKLLAENEQLKKQNGNLQAELENHKKSENSVLNTLESAKHLMNDISASAEKRAEVIIKNAQLDAEVIQRDARESVSRLTDEGEKLRRKVERFRERYRQLLEDEMSQIDGSSADLLADLENDFLPASLANNVEEHQSGSVEPKKETDVKEASLEDILMKDFSSNDESKKTIVRHNDLTKTRII